MYICFDEAIKIGIKAYFYKKTNTRIGLRDRTLMRFYTGF